jgi:uncharacterized RDD family membrane protein YckC
MKNIAKVDDLGEGVLFAPEACAGLLTRLLILIIDLSVLLVCGVVLETICYELLPTAGEALFWSWLALCYIYLVVVEASFGTLGFLITGVKIVNLNGEKPSVLRMTGRLGLWIVGPFNFFIDFFWLTNDRHKQTLRDKLAGTYVVKKGAVPCGKGRVRAVHYFLFGLSILFPEVREQTPSPQGPQDPKRG